MILFQKYKEAIPVWLDEGLANYVSNRGKIDYVWLGKVTIGDVRKYEHPFQATSGDGLSGSDRVKLHYIVSRAVIEMLAAKCGLQDILQLSVGSRLDNYLETLCGISDLNAEFSKWVKSKQPRVKRPPSR